MRKSWGAWLAVASMLGCGDTTNITIKVKLPDGGTAYRPGPAPNPDEDAGEPGEPSDDGGAPPADGGVEPDGGGGPTVIGGLTVDTPAVEHVIDLFAKPGHRFWMQVSDEQLELMNQRWGGGPGIPEWGGGPIRLPYAAPAADPMGAGGADGDGMGDVGGDGDFNAEKPGDVIGDGVGDFIGDGVGDFVGDGIGDFGDWDGDFGGDFDGDGVGDGWEPLPEGDPYTPPGGGQNGEYTYVDHMVVQDVESGAVADYGKVKVRLVGESTFRNWDESQIPNLRMDMDRVTENMRLGGFEHIRLNNGQVGTIFREAITHRVYRAMGYPGLRSSWAFLGSNVWGEDAWIPMVLMEVYKKKFCEDNQDLVGGTCVNMWEFAGDAAGGGWGGIPGNACQVSQCDNAKLDQLAELTDENQPGPGFMEALSGIIDWPRFHQFQCLSWIMWTGDDPLHNANNNLIMERDDGRLVWGPYSVDISAGQSWYTNTPLWSGNSTVAIGCQGDQECWDGVMATCEDMIEKFDALNPELMVDDVKEQLEELGMLRDGDEARYQNLRDWYVWRQENLRDELEQWRYPPGLPCPDGLQRCNDNSCGTEEECIARRCEDPASEWCETLQTCLWPELGQECPNCDEQNPLLCEAVWPPQCVPDMEACHGLCANDGLVWCEAWGSCASWWDCQNGGGGPEPIPL